MGKCEIIKLFARHRCSISIFKRLIYDDISHKNKSFVALINQYTSDESSSIANESKNDLILLSKNLQSKEEDYKDLDEFLTNNGQDELTKLASEEKLSCEVQINMLREKLLHAITKYEETVNNSQSNDFDDCNYTNGLSLEITAGVGGQESSLFVNELLEVYKGYSEYLGLGFNVVQSEETELGGLRKTFIDITGDPELVKNYHYESGVHRIQRVPKTEKYGRTHTSTVAVSVIPKNNAIETEILKQDLIIETCRAQGKGGQHVNTTDSAVRIIHIPTGIVVERQEERSQITNKERALRALKEKLSSMRNLEQYNKTQDTRKSQRGTLARSEKIRTYNFPQDRITDHRTGQNFHDLKNFFAPKNGAAFHNLVTSLQKYFMRQKFREIISRF